MTVDTRIYSYKSNWPAKYPIIIGYVSLFILVFVIGLWSITTRITGAVIANGTIQSTAKSLAIQHPIGGVITQLNVTNSDSVKSGDILLKFDNKQLISKLSIIEKQYFELLARKALYIAERDRQETVIFDDKLLSKANNAYKMHTQMDGHVEFYNVRKSSLKAEKNLIIKQKAQLRAQIKGTEAQETAYNSQLNYIEEELADTTALLNMGLTHKPRILALQREQARIIGQIGQINADRSRLNAAIIGLNIRILQLDNKYRERAIENMREIEPRLNEITEIRASILEKLSQLNVRAPLSGIIHGNQLFGLQSVVKPAETIFYIVPTDQPLIIQAQINVIDADQIYIGQDAVLNLTTLNLPELLSISAKVTKMSADIYTDQKTGRTYYQAELTPNIDEITQLEHIQLLRGMPVDVFFKTIEQTAFSYFTKPIGNYFNKALREL